VERVVPNALADGMRRCRLVLFRASRDPFTHRLEDKTIHLYAQSLGNQNAVKHIEKPLHKQRQ
jgi:hypothetical protein